LEKKVLILADWFAPAFKAGGPVQSLNNLTRQYRDATQYFDVVARNTDHDGTPLPVTSGKWTLYCDRVRVCYMATGTSLWQWYRVVKDSKASVWYINGIFSPLFNLLPILLPTKAQKIIAPRGMLDAGALSQKAFKKQLYVALLKGLRIHKSCIFHAASKEEYNSIRAVFGIAASIYQIANYPKILPLLPPEHKEVGQLRLVSVALVGPMKNHLLVLQALQQCTYTIEYDIYGPILDETYWQQCLPLLQQMPANVKVQYHGNIPPEQVTAALQKAHVFIQPSKSENFGHSLYEALVSGRPIITSHTTPWNDLAAAEAGMNVAIDGYSDIKTAIDFFAAMNHEQYQQWSVSARRYVEKAIDIAAIQAGYEAMFAQVARRKG
jgi:glycosyltransferase involved in cell wall biosynthesis